MANASSTTARSKSGDRATAPNGALTASTLGRMWWAPLNVTLIAISLAMKLVQRGSAKNGATSRFERAAADGGIDLRREHVRQVVVALLVRAQVAALAAVRIAGAVVGFRAVAQQLRQQHRHVLRPAEAGIAALAVQHHADVPGGLAKEQRVRHGQRIADRVAERRDARSRCSQHRGGRELHDAVPVRQCSATIELKGSSFAYPSPNETE